METIEKPMNEQESLQLIHEMINVAQKRFSNDSFRFLLWGWIATTAFILGYVWCIIGKPQYIGYTWAILGTVGGIVSGFYGRKETKTKTVVTYADEYLKYTWIAYMVSYFIVLGALISLQRFDLINPMCLVLIGISTFITGGLLKFKPLIYGGVIFWIGACISFAIRTEFQFLISGLTAACGYLIPGYLLKARNKNENI